MPQDIVAAGKLQLQKCEVSRCTDWPMSEEEVMERNRKIELWKAHVESPTTSPRGHESSGTTITQQLQIGLKVNTQELSSKRRMTRTKAKITLQSKLCITTCLMAKDASTLSTPRVRTGSFSCSYSQLLLYLIWQLIWQCGHPR